MKRVFKNIIIFNPFGIGDVIFSTPLIEALNHEYRDAKITYICNKRVRCMLQNNPYLKEILVFEKDDFRNLAKKSRIKLIAKFFGFLKKIRVIKADLMIDLSLNYQASFIMKLLGVPMRIGFNYRNRGKFLTDKLDLKGFENKHVVLYYLDLLKLLDIRYRDIFPKTFTSSTCDEWAERFIIESDLDNRFLVGIVPGGGRSWGEHARYRRWPASNFAHIADELINKFKVKVILFGGNREASLCSDIESLMTNTVVNMGGKTDIGQFMALIRKCRFILCNEGGPLHVAVALGVPSISIFGPVDEKVYGPFSYDMSRHIVVTDDIRCRPCYSRFKHKKCEPLDCLNNISEGKILDSIDALMKRIKDDEKDIVRA